MTLQQRQKPRRPVVDACACILLLCATASVRAEQCTYSTWDWDKRLGQSVNHRRIVKDRAELSPQERGTISGCTVCEQDQSEIRAPGLPPFKVCRALREPIVRALDRARAEGFLVLSAVGYRVGKTKGAVDAQGYRTAFSNHSYGVAIDINAERNGLYDFCWTFGPGCKLLRGGVYQSGMPGVITRDGVLYRALRAEGFKWGGELSGKQKDFMHFSLDGM